MAPTKRGQSKHDQEVAKVARRLKRQGYNVKADLPGQEQPTPIGKNKFIPDIEATKRGHTKIIEVETPESIKTDTKQQETFRRSAAQKRNKTFEIHKTD